MKQGLSAAAQSQAAQQEVVRRLGSLVTQAQEWLKRLSDRCTAQQHDIPPECSNALSLLISASSVSGALADDAQSGAQSGEACSGADALRAGDAAASHATGNSVGSATGSGGEEPGTKPGTRQINGEGERGAAQSDASGRLTSPAPAAPVGTPATQRPALPPGGTGGIVPSMESAAAAPPTCGLSFLAQIGAASPRMETRPETQQPSHLSLNPPARLLQSQSDAQRGVKRSLDASSPAPPRLVLRAE